MDKLSFQDSFFLRAESPTCPFHVASLMVLSPPSDAPDNYLRSLVEQLGRLHEVWPVFGRRLDDPTSMRDPKWVKAEDFDPKDHVFHYKLPRLGQMSDLLDLTGRAHEKALDRMRPLWEVHLIEGLPDGKFALYFKVHHALVDGVGGLRLMQEMLSKNPEDRLLSKPEQSKPVRQHSKESLGHAIKHSLNALLKQSKAVPETYSMLAHFGLDRLLGKKDAPQLPFSAPRTLLNSKLSTRRRFIISELPLEKINEIGKYYDGTINDVLIAICGSALRQYLLKLDELPERSLDAGVPVSIKGGEQSNGNQLSFIICPFGTDELDPVKRLQGVIRSTKKGKLGLAHMSPGGTEGLATMTMVPFLMLTLTHSSQRFPPVFNTIVSNVPGPKEEVFLEGSRLERVYPMSIVTDGMGLNITVISYQSTLCIGITSAPANEPYIETFGELMQKGYEELLASISKT